MSAKRAPKIRCPKCKGAGHVAMPLHMIRTLVALKHGAHGLFTQEIASVVGVAPTAMVNRMHALHALGLVEMHQHDGRTLRWTLSGDGWSAIR